MNKFKWYKSFLVSLLKSVWLYPLFLFAKKKLFGVCQKTFISPIKKGKRIIWKGTKETEGINSLKEKKQIIFKASIGMMDKNKLTSLITVFLSTYNSKLDQGHLTSLTNCGPPKSNTSSDRKNRCITASQIWEMACT